MTKQKLNERHGTQAPKKEVVLVGGAEGCGGCQEEGPRGFEEGGEKGCLNGVGGERREEGGRWS